MENQMEPWSTPAANKLWLHERDYDLSEGPDGNLPCTEFSIFHFRCGHVEIVYIHKTEYCSMHDPEDGFSITGSPDPCTNKIVCTPQYQNDHCAWCNGPDDYHRRELHSTLAPGSPPQYSSEERKERAKKWRAIIEEYEALTSEEEEKEKQRLEARRQERKDDWLKKLEEAREMERKEGKAEAELTRAFDPKEPEAKYHDTLWSVVDLADPAVQDSNCPICRGSYAQGMDGTGVGKPRKLVNCGHIYHIECISFWFESRITCPMCTRDQHIVRVPSWDDRVYREVGYSRSQSRIGFRAPVAGYVDFIHRHCTKDKFWGLPENRWGEDNDNPDAELWPGVIDE